MSASIAAPDLVEADVTYLHYDGRRPATYAYPPPGVPQRTGIPDVRRVQIADARRLPEPPTLDVYGFERRVHPTAVTDFGSEDHIRSIYYREAEDIIRQATGAEKVVIFDHTLRSSLADGRTETTREPVRFVHNDQTFVSGPRRVRDHLPPDEATARLRGRFAIINLWRPIDNAVECWPLAVIDGRTIDTEDLVPSDLIYRDKVGETYAIVHRTRHRWFYFPRLGPDEVVLLKIYDSQADGPVRLSAHTAFDDPSSPPDAPPRRSIELRTLVFYPS